MGREAEALSKMLAPRFAVVATGLGIRRTIPSLLKLFREEKPDLLVFTGSASQLDLSLKMGDIVLPRQWLLEDGPGFHSTARILTKLEKAGFTTSDKGLTLLKPVMKAGQRDQLFQQTGASIYDPVTAAVLRVAETEGVECVTPKIVASTTKSGLMTFWGNLDRNISPLARYLERLLELVVSQDKARS